MFRLTVEFTKVNSEISKFMEVCKLEQNGNCFERTGDLNSMLRLASHVTNLQIDPNLRDQIRMISVVPTED